MKTLPLLLAAGLYGWQAVSYALAGQHAFSGAFVAYAAANIFFAAAT